MERMAGIMTFQHTMDLMGSKETQRLVKEPTMHIVFIHGQEYNLHCFGVENCFSNLWASIEQSKLIGSDIIRKSLGLMIYIKGCEMLPWEIIMRILTWLSMASEQNMLQLYQDSMAICHAFCKPDVFLTMTANPNWVEIQEALLKEP